MGIKATALTVTAVAALAALPLAHGAHAAGSGVQSSATGSGDVNFGDGLRTFSFAATQRSGAAAAGEAQVDNRARDSRAHVQLDCLVVDGAIAYVGGTVDHASNADLVGAPVVFAVEDNGEGAASTPDQITALFVGSSDCTDAGNQSDLAGALFPIAHGNVQVH